MRKRNCDRVKVFFTKSSLTEQHHKESCDINKIMDKWNKTGIITHVSQYQGSYADLSELPTYQEALDKVIACNDMFMTLPANVRKMFQNDPQAFLEFTADPKNADEMVKLGLATPKQSISAEPKPSADTDNTGQDRLIYGGLENPSVVFEGNKVPEKNGS